MKIIKKIISKILSTIKSLFLTGLFAILPAAITILILNFTYKLIANWLKPLKDIEPIYLQKIPGSEIIIITILLIILGILIKALLVSPIIHRFERIVAKIPIISSIYSSVKILANFFNVPDPKKVERKVVLIQYPNDKFYNIAFLLGSASDMKTLIPKEKQKEGEEYVKIFMPNSPNPSSGYFFVMPKSETIDTDITFEEAIKTVVSCGLITPQSIKEKLKLL